MSREKIAGPSVDVIPLVRLPRTVRQRYSYKTTTPLFQGDLVQVKFHGRRIHAVVCGPGTSSAETVLKPVDAVLDGLRLTPWQMSLAKMLSEFYGAPESLAFLTVAGGLARKATEGLPVLTSQKRFPVNKRVRLSYKKIFSQRGRVVLAGENFSPAHPLVQHLIQESLAANKQVLCLFPDAYSAQYAASLFASLFPTILAESESGTEKMKNWNHVARSQSLVVCGTRSAIFLPFSALDRVFVFSEEDDGHRSWDQEPHYDVRSLLIEMIPKAKIALIAASILPTLTSSNKSVLYFATTAFASTLVIEDTRRRTKQVALTDEDFASLAQSAPDKRILIYTNRLGKGLLACSNCHEVLTCLACHHPFVAGVQKSPNTTCRRCATPRSGAGCASCGGQTFRSFGGGTESVVSALQSQVTHTPIVQIDSTTAPTSATLNNLLEHIRVQPGIVVASPIILNRLWTLPKFHTTIALKPELDLALPSWKANEESLHTLARLWAHTSDSFRVNTANPDHPILKMLKAKQFREALAAERDFRERFWYPPNATLVLLKAKRGAEVNTEALAEKIRSLPETRLHVTAGHIVVRTHEKTLNSLWAVLDNAWHVDINPLIVS